MSKKPFKKPSFSGGPKTLLIAIVVLVGLLFALTQLTDYARNMSELSYKEFLDKVRSGDVKSVEISGEQINGVFKSDQEKIALYNHQLTHYQDVIIENDKIIAANNKLLQENEAMTFNGKADQLQIDLLTAANVKLSNTNKEAVAFCKNINEKISMITKESKGLLDERRFQAIVVQRESDIELFDQYGVDYSVASPGVSSNIWYIMLLILFLSFLGIISAWYINKQGKNNNGQGGGGLFNMGKSRAKIFMPNTIKEKFASVAGAHDAKEELTDVVDFLKNPAKYRKIGAQIPRGVLLQGEPGTGKTLLARAVAGEAHCPFISVSGSDFVEVFVGVGASRVRDLFAQAKRNAPCIVFIDEIDAVGRQRSGGGQGGSDEREQTLNQLLTEMDGFEVNEEPIIVMAATNRADVLDKALLRPGRFDRIVTVPVPDLISREEILKVHLKKVKVASDIDAHKLARVTTGYTGADLANFINTAAIIAIKAGLDKITMAQFDEAYYSDALGKHAKTLIMNDDEKKITAYHEGGHTLINILMGDLSEPLHKVTITPRTKGSLGVTCMLPSRERYLKTKEEFLADICISMGGRAAEILFCNVMTAGAGSDFRGATGLAYNMVAHWGMTQELGMAVYTNRENVSGETTARMDIEVTKILDEQYKRACQLLTEHRDKVEIIAALLLEKEMVEASEIYEAIGMTQPEMVKLI